MWQGVIGVDGGISQMKDSSTLLEGESESIYDMYRKRGVYMDFQINDHESIESNGERLYKNVLLNIKH